ncbi:hypothetical protein [Rhizobium giardinii]|uniref:Uncharacterized protein n=1 Tax=Rhizobium giardinii TaxID=56731 RepID=A0A7W8UDN8_9HYPH|nr:hypothetical protein [Rhizobium giardinii]MBB5536844.1 hypothetical protein [Rhizobium giardinii]
MSDGRKAAAFHYTDAERKALAEAVPDPDWVDKLDDWGRLASFPHHEEFRADKEGFIARALEPVARECLAEETAYRPPKEEIARAREAARVARKLRSLLAQPNTIQPNYAILFTGHDKIFGHLDEVIDNEELAVDDLASYHAEDPFSSERHPGFRRFADAAIIYWRVWTDKPAGASKSAKGGPAARFLVAAINPLIAFANQRGRKLRHRRGELTVEAAGELIIELRRAELPLD